MLKLFVNRTHKFKWDQYNEIVYVCLYTIYSRHILIYLELNILVTKLKLKRFNTILYLYVPLCTLRLVDGRATFK